jgi:hypothetical protein
MCVSDSRKQPHGTMRTANAVCFVCGSLSRRPLCTEVEYSALHTDSSSVLCAWFCTVATAVTPPTAPMHIPPNIPPCGHCAACVGHIDFHRLTLKLQGRVRHCRVAVAAAVVLLCCRTSSVWRGTPPVSCWRPAATMTAYGCGCAMKETGCVQLCWKVGGGSYREMQLQLQPVRPV